MANNWQRFLQNTPHCLTEGDCAIFDRQWKTKVLHWFSRTDILKEEKENFLQSLINFDDNCGGFFKYQAYFIAAESLVYFEDCGRADEIISQLLKLSYAYFRQDRKDWKSYPKALTKVARETLEITDRKRVITHFEQLLHVIDNRTILRLASEKLGQINPYNKHAVAALTLLAHFPKNDIEFLAITKSLLKVAPNHPVIIPSLIRLAQSSPYNGGWQIVRSAILLLEEVANSNELAITTLISLTRDLHLLFLEEQSEQLIDPEKTLSQETKSLLLYETAVQALGEIGFGHERGIIALIELIQSDQLFQITNYLTDSHIYTKLVEALGKIATGSQVAITLLSQLLLNCQHEIFCCYIASALIRIDPKNERAISSLTQIVENTWTQLTKIGSSKAISENTRSFQENQLEFLLFLSSDALMQVDSSNKIVQNSLLYLVQCSHVNYLPLTAAYSLQKISLELAIDALLCLITRDSSDQCWWESIRHLGQIAIGNEKAISILAQLIQRSTSKSDLTIAAYSLGRIDPGNALAITTLSSLLGSFGDEREWRIACWLGQIDDFSEAVTLSLVNFVQTFQNLGSELEQRCLVDRFKHLSLLKTSKEIVKYLRIILSFQNSHKIQINQILDENSQNIGYEIEGIRWEICYEIIWHCAHNIHFLDFDHIWKNSS